MLPCARGRTWRFTAELTPVEHFSLSPRAFSKMPQATLFPHHSFKAPSYLWPQTISVVQYLPGKFEALCLISQHYQKEKGKEKQPPPLPKETRSKLLIQKHKKDSFIYPLGTVFESMAIETIEQLWKANFKINFFLSFIF